MWYGALSAWLPSLNGRFSEFTNVGAGAMLHLLTDEQYCIVQLLHFTHSLAGECLVVSAFQLL